VYYPHCTVSWARRIWSSPTSTLALSCPLYRSLPIDLTFQVSRTKCVYLWSLLYKVYTPSISFSFTWSPKQYLGKSANYLYRHKEIFSIFPVCTSLGYIPKYLALKYIHHCSLRNDHRTMLGATKFVRNLMGTRSKLCCKFRHFARTLR
jgi:hypothetical protein